MKPFGDREYFDKQRDALKSWEDDVRFPSAMRKELAEKIVIALSALTHGKLPSANEGHRRTTKKRKGPASQAEQPNPSLTITERAVFSIIKAQPKGEGINGKEILKALKTAKVEFAESTLRRHILPKLILKCGVINHPATGGYILR